MGMSISQKQIRTTGFAGTGIGILANPESMQAMEHILELVSRRDTVSVCRRELRPRATRPRGLIRLLRRIGVALTN